MFRRSLFAVPLFAIAACAPTRPAATTRTVVLFFTPESAALDQNAQAAVSQAAELIQQRGNVTVQVRGFAAPNAGSPAYNASLSRTRAEAVVDALVNAGVARTQIIREERGAVPFELMATESRRVEIVIGT